MAAKQMIDYLETGTIKNSVNFPAAQPDRQDSQCSRLCVINKNVPGALGEITTLLGSAGVNITQQVRARSTPNSTATRPKPKPSAAPVRISALRAAKDSNFLHFPNPLL